MTSPTPSPTPSPSLDLDPIAADTAFLSAVCTYYHSRLEVSAKPMNYLNSHSAGEPSVWSELTVGYGDRTLGPGTKDRQTRARLKSLGILKPNGRELFHGALTTPLNNAEGKVSAVYGRVFNPNLPSSTQRERWAGEPEGALWNRSNLLELSEPLVICPSLIDALSCACHGYRRVSFAVDDAHLEQLLSTLAACGVSDALLLGVKTELTRTEVTLHHIPGRYGRGVWRWLAGAASPADALREAVDRAEPEPVLTSSPPEAVAEPEPEVRGADVPEADTPDMDEATGDVHIGFDRRQYRVRGLDNNSRWDVLRINLRVMVDETYHLDHVDLYSSRDRIRFVKHASLEIHMDEDIIKSDLGRILMHLERLQEERLAESDREEEAYAMSPEEREAAMAYLMADDLPERIVSDFRRCGLVGEDTNALIGYLASISRKLDDPLSVIIQSSSSAGKSSLMEAIMRFVPSEEKIHLTTMTSQSLYYMQRDGLRHKTVAISESEGMERAGYALKLLQSEKRLSIATTGRDGKTGRQVTHHYTVEGPIQTIITSTDSEIDEELQNRAIVLTVSEDRQQTRAIHERQRYSHTLEGMLTRHDTDALISLHHNVQRLLEPVMVVNPHAEQLRFSDNRLRSRRDHLKYLNLIRAFTLLHQHRRKRHSIERDGTSIIYVESTPEDVAAANTLMSAVMQNATDCLAPQTRRLLDDVTRLVESTAKRMDVPPGLVTLTRRQIRDHVNIPNTRLGDQLRRLIEHEYLSVKRGPHGRKEYTLVHTADDASSHRSGFVTPSET